MHWTVHISGGPLRVNHAAVAVGTYIYSFGGCSSFDDFEVGGNIDVHILDTDTLRWKPLAYTAECAQAIPFQRYGHTVVLFGYKIYLWGGRNDFHSSDTLHCFDTKEFKWSLPKVSGQVPRPSDGHTACVIGNYMYVFGGYEEETEMFKEGLHRINLTTFVWEDVETKGIVPASRDFHTASAIGTRMYIFGGRSYDFGIDTFDGGIYSNDIAYLETSTMTWVWPKTQGWPPCGRRSHSAFVYENQLYILCGYNSMLEKHFNDMFKYNPETNVWSYVKCQGIGPIPRRRQCCCIVNDRLYLFGGTSPDEIASNHPYALHSQSQNLIDHSDLHVLDMFPSLYRLCLLKVIVYQLDYSCLPEFIKREIHCMTTDNSISNGFSIPKRGFVVQHVR